jgi:hypothetical protein
MGAAAMLVEMHPAVVNFKIGGIWKEYYVCAENSGARLQSYP